ncbi:MAG: glycoside hydrolase family 3 C-terminal domain-containing protein [Gammaproteobacteria bacterium]|nr:glycoside hydrolase family 3 C-terminal domain-containing protein [Gammaproteobacteria bacterium]
MKTIVKGSTNPEVSKLELENQNLAREAAIEGMVLLKNDGILPLKNKKIALYGAGARMTVKGGTGSGEVRNRHSVSIAEGLENEGFNILTNSWLDGFDKYYADTYEAYRLETEKKVEGLREFYQILHNITPFVYPTGMPVREEDIVKCNTAIYVLSRQAGEGHDRLAEKADYFLSDVEAENLRFLRKNYKKLILVVNVGGLIDLSILEEVKVNALVYFVQGGEEGGSALAKLFSGEANFSGKLTTTWPHKFEDVPSSKNYSYWSSDKYRQDYNEGIYVGYRYYDRFNVSPLFPFGYGLSYTSFNKKLVELTPKKGKINLKVEVENTGSVDGKEVVQVYSTLPSNDSENKRLVAFNKSSLLKPNEKEVLSLDFNLKDIAIYDESEAAWVVKSGEYHLLIGDSQNNEAVHILRAKEDYLIEKCTNICPLSVDLVEIDVPRKALKIEDNLPILEIDKLIPDAIVHSYEEVKEEIDPLIKSMNDEDLCTLVIGGTTQPKNTQVTSLGASGSTTPLLYEKYGLPNVILSDGPAGLNLTRHVVQLSDGTVKAARVEANIEAYKRYLFGFAGMALKAQMANPADGESHYQMTTAWPASQLLAQSFNIELLERIGDGVGKEMEEYGVTIWLAPGMNIHRNPLCGRTFEYYSEDPLLSGKMAAAIVRGVQSHEGKGMSVKHYVANNCELERNSSSSNLKEKTLREIYLRGFEIAVKESNPVTVMASYNLVNGLHVVNNYDLLTKVLRNEWGFKGLIMSDWDSMKASRENPCVPVTGDVQKAHAAGLDLVCPGRPDQHIAILEGLKSGNVKRVDLERAGERVLKLIRFNNVIESK